MAKGTPGQPAQRVAITFCRECDAEMPLGTRECPDCGYWNGTKAEFEADRADRAKRAGLETVDLEVGSAPPPVRRPLPTHDLDVRVMALLAVAGVVLLGTGVALGGGVASALEAAGTVLLGISGPWLIVRGAVLSALRARDRERERGRGR